MSDFKGFVGFDDRNAFIFQEDQITIGHRPLDIGHSCGVKGAC